MICVICGKNVSGIMTAVVKTLCAPTFGGDVDINVCFSDRMHPSVDRASVKKHREKSGSVVVICFMIPGFLIFSMLYSKTVTLCDVFCIELWTCGWKL